MWEEILASLNNYGNHLTVVMLMDNLRRKKNWVKELLLALQETKHTDLAQELSKRYRILRSSTSPPATYQQEPSFLSLPAGPPTISHNLPPPRSAASLSSLSFPNLPFSEPSNTNVPSRSNNPAYTSLTVDSSLGFSSPSPPEPSNNLVYLNLNARNPSVAGASASQKSSASLYPAGPSSLPPVSSPPQPPLANAVTQTSLKVAAIGAVGCNAEISVTQPAALAPVPILSPESPAVPSIPAATSSAEGDNHKDLGDYRSPIQESEPPTKTALWDQSSGARSSESIIPAAENEKKDLAKPNPSPVQVNAHIENVGVNDQVNYDGRLDKKSNTISIRSHTGSAHCSPAEPAGEPFDSSQMNIENSDLSKPGVLQSVLSGNLQQNVNQAQINNTQEYSGNSDRLQLSISDDPLQISTSINSRTEVAEKCSINQPEEVSFPLDETIRDGNIQAQNLQPAGGQLPLQTAEEVIQNLAEMTQPCEAEEPAQEHAFNQRWNSSDENRPQPAEMTTSETVEFSQSAPQEADSVLPSGLTSTWSSNLSQSSTRRNHETISNSGREHEEMTNTDVGAYEVNIKEDASVQDMAGNDTGINNVPGSDLSRQEPAQDSSNIRSEQKSKADSQPGSDEQINAYNGVPSQLEDPMPSIIILLGVLAAAFGLWRYTRK
nr:PREDICTED: endochitinase A-like isoform X2 [Latimeria chalumnae]|eukprot:XP_014350050.1 PREDICTED: endochitinase A-like isoform X2 [Latimeria chalumnae]